jgi:hypothetical protein
MQRQIIPNNVCGRGDNRIAICAHLSPFTVCIERGLCGTLTITVRCNLQHAVDRLYSAAVVDVLLPLVVDARRRPRYYIPIGADLSLTCASANECVAYTLHGRQVEHFHILPLIAVGGVQHVCTHKQHTCYVQSTHVFFGGKDV